MKYRNDVQQWYGKVQYKNNWHMYYELERKMLELKNKPKPELESEFILVKPRESMYGTQTTST